MQNRRDFLKTAALAAIGSGMAMNGLMADESKPSFFNINTRGLKPKMQLRFFP